jgi:hypothetical protein
MGYLWVVDESGRNDLYESAFVPRIGESIHLEYLSDGQPTTPRHFRVKDVAYNLCNHEKECVGILVEEQADAELWLT